MKRALPPTLLLILLALLAAGCSAPAAPEVTPQEIRLTRPASISYIEASGMDWYGDWLVLLPQYPARLRREANNPDGALRALSRQELLDYLDGRGPDRLDPRLIPLDDGGLREMIDGFQGYEAVAFAGDRVYLSIEASSRGRMHAYLVRGSIQPDLSALRLDPATLTEVPLEVQAINFSVEALLVKGDEILTFFEANGALLNPSPQAQRFSLDLEPLGALDFPRLEYRLTDATRLDADGRFWVANYFIPADPRLWTLSDPLAEQHGRPRSSRLFLAAERLVELQLGPEGITLTERAPVHLRVESLLGTNWEGIARLDGRGLLVISDRQPDTILAFVPFEPQE